MTSLSVHDAARQQVPRPVRGHAVGVLADQATRMVETSECLQSPPSVSNIVVCAKSFFFNIDRP